MRDLTERLKKALKRLHGCDAFKAGGGVSGSANWCINCEGSKADHEAQKLLRDVLIHLAGEKEQVDMRVATTGNAIDNRTLPPAPADAEKE